MNKTLTLRFYDPAYTHPFKYAVLIARSGSKWVLCRHRDRTTLEFPGGHHEAGEMIEETARRELYEETGAITYRLEPVCVYSVTAPWNYGGEETFGMLYYAEIETFEGALHSEIAEIRMLDTLPECWTYPDIQPALLREAIRRGIVPA